jgi:NAD(P)-dependent dehydrogenase (short-subunit alcohol dehydrogenase family)
MPRTFLVTGAGWGLGRAAALAAVRPGHTVVGTVRRGEDQSLETIGPGRAYIRRLDTTDEQAVGLTVEEVEHGIAPIDVLVSNAGYGHEGVVEESTMADLRRQFEVNVFGAVAVIKAVLPYMRERRRGHIIAITSMGGHVTAPGRAFYHGSTYALEGIMDTLGQEVAGLGIDVTAVEPGSFRVDWAGPPIVHAPRSIADYDVLFQPGIDGPEPAIGLAQVGDPDRAGQAILDLVETPQPPAHLLLETVLFGD